VIAVSDCQVATATCGRLLLTCAPAPLLRGVEWDRRRSSTTDDGLMTGDGLFLHWVPMTEAESSAPPWAR